MLGNSPTAEVIKEILPLPANWGKGIKRMSVLNFYIFEAL